MLPFPVFLELDDVLLVFPLPSCHLEEQVPYPHWSGFSRVAFQTEPRALQPCPRPLLTSRGQNHKRTPFEHSAYPSIQPVHIFMHTLPRYHEKRSNASGGSRYTAASTAPTHPSASIIKSRKFPVDWEMFQNQLSSLTLKIFCFF